MVAYTFVQRLNLPIAPIVAGGLALLIAAAALVTPAPFLESLVMASGIPAFVPAAEPPLGVTARVALALMGGGGAGLFAWVALSLVPGLRRPVTTAGDPVLAVRRADAHPDAPPRPPLMATRDLGRPFLEIRAPESVAESAAVDTVDTFDGFPAPVVERIEQDIPLDLNQPLSAFDPEAIRETPIAPPPPPPVALRRTPRPAVVARGERFETYTLNPPPPLRAVEPTPKVDPIVASQTDASIHALLDRLERGITRRSVAAEPHGLEDALTTLRKLAMR